MKSMGKRGLLGVLTMGACFALGSTGCFFEASTDAGPAPPPPVAPPPLAGSLTVQWTVDEVTDPNVCIMGNASTLDIVLTTAGGGFAGEFQGACTAFTTTISSLAPGDYAASARLLDAGGRPRTTIINLHPFTIVENTNLVVNLDFPADSFL